MRSNQLSYAPVRCMCYFTPFLSVCQSFFHAAKRFFMFICFYFYFILRTIAPRRASFIPAMPSPLFLTMTDAKVAPYALSDKKENPRRLSGIVWWTCAELNCGLTRFSRGHYTLSLWSISSAASP